MKKFLFSSTLALAAMSAMAAGTDVISAPMVREQFPDLNWNAENYTDEANTNEPFVYSGETGSKYEIKGMASNGEWLGLAYGGFIRSTESAGFIAKLEISNQDMWTSELEIRVSENPITDENKWDCRKIYITGEKNADDFYDFIWEADEICRYFMLETNQTRYKDIMVTYGDDAPEIQVETPVISCWGEIVAGANVNVSTATDNAQLHVKVYVNGNLDEGTEDNPTTAVVDRSWYSFSLPGKTGDVVRVEAVAKKEGYVDSDTATVEYTLELPQCYGISCSQWGSVCPGMEIEFLCSTEGAEMTYTYGYYMVGNDTSFESQQITASLPAKIRVPEEVEPGFTFWIEGYASAEGFRDSEIYNFSWTVISSTLNAPVFSIPSGEVRKGTAVSITRPEYATAIHYTVNGGEEQMSEEWSVRIVIDEDSHVEAWATAPEPWKTSETISADYTLEKFSETTDVLTPAFFSDDTEANGGKEEEFSRKSDVTGIDYTYLGGFWTRGDEMSFWIQFDDAILYNSLSVAETVPPFTVKRFKIDVSANENPCYIMFSNENPITVVTEEMTEFEYPGSMRLRIGNNQDICDYAYGEWVNLDEVAQNTDIDGFLTARYFAMYKFGQQGNPCRLVVDYDMPDVGVDTVGHDTDVKDYEVYDLNGLKMNKDRLAPGIYIRKIGSKSMKFIVK